MHHRQWTSAAFASATLLAASSASAQTPPGAAPTCGGGACWSAEAPSRRETQGPDFTVSYFDFPDGSSAGFYFGFAPMWPPGGGRAGAPETIDRIRCERVDSAQSGARRIDLLCRGWQANLVIHAWAQPSAATGDPATTQAFAFLKTLRRNP